MLKDAAYEGAKDSSKGLMVGMLGDARGYSGSPQLFSEGMLVGDVRFVLETLLRPLVADVFARYSFFS